MQSTDKSFITSLGSFGSLEIIGVTDKKDLLELSNAVGNALSLIKLYSDIRKALYGTSIVIGLILLYIAIFSTITPPDIVLFMSALACIMVAEISKAVFMSYYDKHQPTEAGRNRLTMLDIPSVFTEEVNKLLLGDKPYNSIALVQIAIAAVIRELDYCSTEVEKVELEVLPSNRFVLKVTYA